MPDDARLDTGFQLLPNSQGSKELLVPHDVLLEPGDLFSTGQLNLPVNIGNAISKQIQETLLREQGSEDSVGWSIVCQVRDVLGRTLDGKTVAMGQDDSLVFLRHLIIAIFDNAYVQFRICFAKYIEENLVAGGGGIESSLNGNNPFVVVLLIVGEDHQLRDIDEATEPLVFHPGLDAVLFGKNTFCVVRLFNLNEGKGEAIYKARDVGAEVVSAFLVLTGEFCGDVPLVVVWVGKIYQLDATNR